MKTLSYEEFEKIIETLRDKYERLDKISEALNWCEVYDISMGDQVADLLSYIFDDKDDWISYWMFERDFGRDWYVGCVKDGDGVDIDLSTVRNLYDFLIENMRKE